MKAEMLEVGDIVQLSPDFSNQMFAYCFMTVTDLKVFGAQGYVQVLGENGKCGGQAYIRVNWADMERTGGKAEWVAE